MSTAGDNGLSVEARDALVKAFGVLRRYLAGTLEVGGATIKGGPSLALHMAADGEGLICKVVGPRPKVAKQLGPLSITGELDRIVVTEDDLLIVVDGLPDVTIKVK